MERLKSGDSESFYYVVEKYNKLLWVVVGGILKNVGTSEDIEECISDVYVSLWKNPGSFDPQRGQFKTFLAVAAKNKALDRYRQLVKLSGSVGLDEAILSSDDDLLDDIIKHEMYRDLYEAIHTLDEPNKEILMRRLFFNEKPSGIADSMFLPVKEVENRLYQSKQKLRKLLYQGG
jgi:RNA polymerase sigma-70 factor (ECF subfamily)